MKTLIEFGKSLVSAILIAALLACFPVDALAQAQNSRSYLLECDTPVLLRVNENFNSSDKAEVSVIQAVVENDVFSADGSRVLVKAGTPAIIDVTTEYNGNWGKPGRITITNASTRTVDNKRIAMRLSCSKKGSSRVGGVITLSVLFFPLGFISGLIKGSMPKIANGTLLNATTVQDIECSYVSEQ